MIGIKDLNKEKIVLLYCNLSKKKRIDLLNRLIFYFTIIGRESYFRVTNDALKSFDQLMTLNKIIKTISREILSLNNFGVLELQKSLNDDIFLILKNYFMSTFDDFYDFIWVIHNAFKDFYH